MKNLLLPLLLAAIFNTELSAQRNSIAPDFKVTDVNGTTHYLYEDYLDAGKFVLIDFFTTGCGGCQLYAPQVNESFRQFGCNEGDMIFLAINYGADNYQVQQFDSTFGIEFPSISGLEGGGNDVNNLYEITYYPRVIVISPDKQIVINELSPPTTENINDTLLALGLEFTECISFEVPEALTEKNEEELLISPNPATNNINISFGSDGKTPIHFTIIDLLGNKVIETRQNTFAEGVQEIHLSTINLSRGVYFVQMHKKNSTIKVKKIIIS